jgi:tRNA threonylcarbamoyl adenosine modification protein YeaZ
MPVILAIDTSLTGCGVCLYDSDKDIIIAHEQSLHDTRQAEELAPMVERVWKDRTEIDHVAVTTGPGSFTGIRIGLSFAKTFAFGIGVPVIAVQSFDVARMMHGDDHIFLIDTKRGDFYRYKGDEGITISSHKDENAIEISQFDLSAIARASLKYPSQNAKPVYVREAEVSVSKTIPPQIIA